MGGGEKKKRNWKAKDLHYLSIYQTTQEKIYLPKITKKKENQMVCNVFYYILTKILLIVNCLVYTFIKKEIAN